MGRQHLGQTTVPVAAQSGVTAIAAGGAHTVALKNDGSVVAWGYNESAKRRCPSVLERSWPLRRETLHRGACP